MRPATLRRLLVLGVCAVGVAGLYLVPGVSTPSRIGVPSPALGPQGAPSSVSDPERRPEERPSPLGHAGTTGRESEPAVETSEPATGDVRTVSRRTSTTVERNGPAGEAERPDREAPSTVTDVSFPTMTPTELTIRWPEATDNVSVAHYRVWLNGFQVADTAARQVVVPWFNDGSREQVVQVRAVDAAGNQSADAPALLVERPEVSASSSAVPTPAPAASDAATPGPAEPSGSSAAPSAGDSAR